jgi:PLD-like domain
MACITATKASFTVKAYTGDNKTLLAFNFNDASMAKNLAGFTIGCKPPGGPSYYLFNQLQFQDPSKHAKVDGEPPNSSANAPIQKYRWTHVPGSNHQGTKPATGNYEYTVTPRYFDENQSMRPLDPSLSVSVTAPVTPFKKGALSLGFTRGYMQSQAFAHHFGNSRIQPAGSQLQFNTSAVAGKSPSGKAVTYEDIYDWMGSTARQQVYDVLNTVVTDQSLHLDVFAYDLNEPGVIGILLKLAAQGRVRIILDNAQLHVDHIDSKTQQPVKTGEDAFTRLFKKQAKPPAAILRGCFARYSHEKIFIVSKAGSAQRVLTGATNFSINGLYVNANHVLVFDDPDVASEYAKVFEQSWQVLKVHPKGSAPAKAFSSTALATQPYTYESRSVPKMTVTFSPHTTADASKILNGISARIKQEQKASSGNVLFAVMQLTGSETPVYQSLFKVHESQSLYSYGISDSPRGTFLYKTGSREGVLVTGKPGKTTLPPPFDQVPSPPGHEIHDKFVVCGLNGDDPVVYCGSSNLASGGEAANGDNLLAIHDADVATAFAIEALLLVDHYNFLDRYAKTKKADSVRKTAGKTTSTKKAVKRPVKAKAAKRGG